MKKKWIFCLFVLVSILSVIFTSLYYKMSITPTNKKYTGTYQFDNDDLLPNENMTSIDYLAIIYLQDQVEGVFTLYNSQDGVIQKGKCHNDGDYLSLNAENKEYLLFFVHNNYYLITNDMKPELLKKISDDAIE